MFALLGDHGADVTSWWPGSGPSPSARWGALPRGVLPRAGLRGAYDEVAGRLIWNDEAYAGSPYHVVVDGRTLSWAEPGLALSGLEGFGFAW